MVPILTIVNMIITLILIFGLPIAFIIYFKGKKGIFKALSAGALGFFLGQYIFRQPLIGLAFNSEAFSFLFENQLMYALTLGFSAGLFELLGRMFIITIFLKGLNQKHHVIAAGFGHGIFEAILVVGFTYVNNILLAFMINNNTISNLLAQGVDQALIDQVVTYMTSTNSWYFLIGGLERVLALVIHIALTILVYMGYKTKRVLPFFALALTAHTVLDVTVVYLQLLLVPIWLVEIVVLAFALMAVVVIKKFLEFKFDDESEAVV